ncbi:MAG: PilZ domain-containing protein [Candidatus Omnitrophica bacterium]|jgi:hypothetical protein|nr:PilZ domain-containing protein [Candidatus Omnitrophota bacterium]MDD3275409.1 PilZ domain-containing protein [Candidatus Omnitrophota bacterium]MDD5077566.1 PilZ domain-containing protein [Candidatus Omnitrophota bacterium]
MHERRKLKRWHIDRRVLCKLKQITNDLYCQIKDINYSGAQVVLNVELPLRTAFKMSLRLSDQYTVDVRAWVTWHKVEGGSNHYGVYFSQIKDADKDKINKFINIFYPDDVPEKVSLPEDIVVENGEEGEGMDDHRIFERFKREISARFVGLDGKEGTARTFDVSAKGLGLSTDRELESQANIEIWLSVPNSSDPLYTRGQVVWSRAAGKGGYQSGVELERADLMGISRLLRS